MAVREERVVPRQFHDVAVERAGELVAAGQFFDRVAEVEQRVGTQLGIGLIEVDDVALNPADPNVSTDLGVAYYYTNQSDRALAQFEKSLATDPKHTKTLLNVGIVRAFGKNDLAGAAKAWEAVVAISPDSPEGQAAKKGLEGVRNAGAATAGK